MIEVYLKTNTDYSTNGDMTLTPISCVYKDSEYLLTLEHPLDNLGRWKYLDYENVIKAEGKLYRIYNVVKSLDTVIAYARPLFFDLTNNILLDTRPTGKTGQEALEDILKGTGYKAHSNIPTVNTAYYVRKNIVEAILGDDENSFLNRWGGEVYLNNYDVYINDRIGSDKGVRVEFGYNLNAIEEDINTDQVATRIIPTGYDGIMLEGDTPWVDSPLIKKYTQPKMRVVNFDDVKVKESEEDEEGFNTIEEAREELVKRVNKLYEEGIDKPQINYKIDMVNLANTTAYKDYIDLVEVDKGDTVTCYIPSLDIDVKARVIDYEKDLITNEYISIELGNARDDFFKDQADISNRVNNAIRPDGSVNATQIKGIIDGMNTVLKAQRNIAQKQKVRAIVFEDTDEASDTYGTLTIGTAGIEIANKKNISGDWDYSTSITANGVNCTTGIYGLILGHNAILDLDKGNFVLGDTRTYGAKYTDKYAQFSHYDGSYTKISADGMEQYYGNTGYKYLNMIDIGTITVDNNKLTYGETFYKIPERFKGKRYSAFVIPSGIETKTNITYPGDISIAEIRAFITDYTDDGFTIFHSCRGEYDVGKWDGEANIGLKVYKQKITVIIIA